jgi:hypothetical protein
VEKKKTSNIVEIQDCKIWRSAQGTNDRRVVPSINSKGKVSNVWKTIKEVRHERAVYGIFEVCW